MVASVLHINWLFSNITEEVFRLKPTAMLIRGHDIANQQLVTTSKNDCRRVDCVQANYNVTRIM